MISWDYGRKAHLVRKYGIGQDCLPHIWDVKRRGRKWLPLSWFFIALMNLHLPRHHLLSVSPAPNSLQLGTMPLPQGHWRDTPGPSQQANQLMKKKKSKLSLLCSLENCPASQASHLWLSCTVTVGIPTACLGLCSPTPFWPLHNPASFIPTYVSDLPLVPCPCP